MDLPTLATAGGVGAIGGTGIWMLIRSMASRASVDRKVDQAQIDTIVRLQELVHDADARAEKAEQRAEQAFARLEDEQKKNTEALVQIASLKGEVQRLTERVEELMRRVQAAAPPKAPQ